MFDNFFIKMLPFSFLYSIIPIIETFVIQLFIYNLEMAKDLSNQMIVNFFLFSLFMFFIILIFKVLYTFVYENIVKNEILHLKEKSYLYFLSQDNSSNNMIQCFTGDLELFRKNYLESVLNCATEVMIYIFSITYLILINVKIGLIMIVISLVPLMVSNLLKTRINRISEEYSKHKANYYTYIKESYSGKECINIYSAFKYFFNKHQIVSNITEIDHFKLNCNIYNAKSIINFLVMGINCISFTIITYLLIDGFISLPKAIAVIQLSNTIVSPLANISENINRINGCSGIVRRLKEYKNYRWSTYSTPNCFSKISIEHLCYRSNEKKILNNIYLALEKNDKILLYGDSGSGKTTLMKCLFGMLDVDDCVVKVDGEISSIKIISGLFSYTSSNEVLFSDSLLANIVMDNEFDQVKYNKILNLCFINEEGFDKLGSDVYSYGEKQRIFIARCMYFDKPIWIWDEALSGLDLYKRNVLEEYVLNQEKTFIHITHNINTDFLIKYNKYVFIDNGTLCVFDNVEDFYEYVQ